MLDALFMCVPVKVTLLYVMENSSVVVTILIMNADNAAWCTLYCDASVSLGLRNSPTKHASANGVILIFCARVVSPR